MQHENMFKARRDAVGVVKDGLRDLGALCVQCHGSWRPAGPLRRRGKTVHVLVAIGGEFDGALLEFPQSFAKIRRKFELKRKKM